VLTLASQSFWIVWWFITILSFWATLFDAVHKLSLINPRINCMVQYVWSSGQSSWLQIQRSRVRFPTLPDFLRSIGSGTGSTQLCKDNWGATWIKKKPLRSRKLKPTTLGIGWADTFYPLKLALTSPTSGGRSVVIIRLQTKAAEFVLFFINISISN
jgi:hypothetical protein